MLGYISKQVTIPSKYIILTTIIQCIFTGVPEYNILPFDPFYAAEVPQVRGGRNFNYKLKLLNVSESGWTISQVTRFR